MFKMSTIINLFLLCITAQVSFAQREKCSYGERGSLTATCENASIRFFKITSYRFDMLDETLRCINCSLDTIEANSFDISGNQIQTLDIRKCNIKVLKPSAFTGLVFMKNLYLQNNNIEELSAGIFKSIKKVERLDIGNNNVKTVFAGAFKELANLTFLNLEHNKIESIDPAALAGLDVLENLNLQQNMLPHAANITNLPKVNTLNLANNVISVVKMGDFINMTELTALNLSNNLISEVTLGSFKTLKKLLTLDLSNNRITTLEPFAFEGLLNLEILTLGHNQLSKLKRYGFSDLANLRELDLNNNKMKLFETGLFTGMPNLGFVNVSNNQLVVFFGTGNMGLASVHTLDLSHNNLTDLDYKVVFNHMPHLVYLKLDHNPWACYLVKEIDEYTRHDNVKLTAEGILTNTSCVNLRKHDVEKMTSRAEEVYDLVPEQGYASGKVVYTLMALMFFVICAMCFVVYRLSTQVGQSGHSFRTTSHANLMSNDILSDDA